MKIMSVNPSHYKIFREDYLFRPSLNQEHPQGLATSGYDLVKAMRSGSSHTHVVVSLLKSVIDQDSTGCIRYL